MIRLLTGENSFEIERELGRIVAGFPGFPERFDGLELELSQLPDILMGVGLFTEKRLVIIRNLSDNKQLWDALPAWLERLSDDITLVLIEPKPDKRTKTYKLLQNLSTSTDIKPWTDREMPTVIKWVLEESKARGLKLDSSLARLLVLRVGTDQWALSNTLDKLEQVGDLSESVIREVVDANPSENAFDLLATALKGDRNRVGEMVEVLSLREDPYQLFGLLSGQVFQLMALASAKEGSNVASDIGAHAFSLSRLKPFARKRGLNGVRRIVEIFTEADDSIKTSTLEPWVAIERALLKVAE